MAGRLDGKVCVITFVEERAQRLEDEQRRPLVALGILVRGDDVVGGGRGHGQAR